MNDLFIYSWNYTPFNNKKNEIIVYGIDKRGNDRVVSLFGYRHDAYLELKDDTVEQSAKNILIELGKKIKSAKPVMKHKLYYYQNELAKFYHIECDSYWNFRELKNAVKAYPNIPFHEADDYSLTPIIKTIARQKISSIGWVKVPGTSCSVNSITQNNSISSYPKICILAIDIECVSVSSRENASNLPNADKPEDEIFNISAVSLNRDGTVKKYLLYLSQEKSIGQIFDRDENEIVCRRYGYEVDLLIGFRDLIREVSPHIITGYNSIKFDWSYMLRRAKMYNKFNEFIRFGMNGSDCKVVFDAEENRKAKRESEDKNYVVQTIDIPGRILIDVMDIVKMSGVRLNQYTLRAVCDYYKIQNKEDMTVHQIFEAYLTQDVDKLKRIGIYCVQDSYVCILLFQKMCILYELFENSKICNVPPNMYYNRGPQLRFISQLYAFCKDNNYVMDCSNYSTEITEYVGAFNLIPKTGLWSNVLAFDFCMTGDTLVSMSNGLSKRIDSLNNDEMLLGYMKNKGFSDFKFINGLQIKGEKQTIKLVLQDGRELTCTPDHKIMVETGEYERADNLKNKYIKCGIGYTEDKNYGDEDGWKLVLNEYEFNMKDKRDISLAFARILGYIYADGSIYKDNKNQPRSEAYFGTMYDAKTFERDVLLILNDRETLNIRKRESPKGSDRAKKGVTFTIQLPAQLSRIIHSVDGIVLGKRSTQAMTLPRFILNPVCPKSIVREFIGGLMGGDGCAPYISTTAGSKFLRNIRFKWTTTKLYLEHMQILFNDLINLFSKLSIHNINIHSIIPIKIRKNSIVPKDGLERYDIELGLDVDQNISFFENIGFRYCINKSCKLYIAYLYQLYKTKLMEQKQLTCDHAKTLIESGYSINNSIKKSIQKYGSLFGKITECSIKTRLCNKIPKRNYAFISILDFVKELGVQNWFESYAVTQDQEFIPSFRQKVIDIRDNGIQPVYDIEVESVHNFVANGISVSNCSLYPSIIQAMNICFTTLIRSDEDLKKLKPEDYNEFIWSDHVNCEHTDHPNYIKKQGKRKIVICGQNVIRFVKSHITKGIVPQLVETFLNRRKQVREQMKHESDPDMLTILDKRQLANKVSANSMYGILGIPKSRGGYLSLMEGAASVTFKGRDTIQKVISDIEQTFDAKAVYGDTDSCMVVLNNHINSIVSSTLLNTLNEKANQVTEYINQKMVRPMSLAFEGKIYYRMLILAKKRYFNVLISEGVKPKRFEGGETPHYNYEVNCKGLPIKRRGYCSYMKMVYLYVIDACIRNVNKNIILDKLIESIQYMFSRQIPLSQYVVTSQISQEYKSKNIAQALLKDKVYERSGEKIIAGTRLSYVYIEKENSKKHAEFAETTDYFELNRDILRINNIEYLKSQMVNSIDQVLETVYGDSIYCKSQPYKYKRPWKVEPFMARQLRYRQLYDAVIKDIQNHFYPNFIVVTYENQ